jgi:hypothetical protein
MYYNADKLTDAKTVFSLIEQAENATTVKMHQSLLNMLFESDTTDTGVVISVPVDGCPKVFGLDIEVWEDYGMAVE